MKCASSPIPAATEEQRVQRPSLWVSLISWILASSYAALVLGRLARRWMNPYITTDDAFQQLFPFHAILTPEVFTGDLMFAAMRAYLAPLHWWLGAYITEISRDPVITGHVINVVQLALSMIFLFLAVRKIAPTPIALFSVCWFLHTQEVVQRLSGGLPRGWLFPVLSAFLYFLLARAHWRVLATLSVGCLLSAPATLVAVTTYGFSLGWRFIRPDTRASAKRPLINFLVFAPFLFLAAHFSLKRPPEIGRMVSLSVAQEMSAFQRPYGRFPFLPLKSPLTEFRKHGRKIFVNKDVPRPPGVEAVVRHAAFIGLAVVTMLTFWCWRQKEDVGIPELIVFSLAILFIYGASRILAFHLYVPDRYLSAPLALFFFATLPVLLWRRFRFPGLAVFAAVLFLLGGTGLRGNWNFNASARQTPLVRWIGSLPPHVLVAGHPDRMSRVPLLSARRTYVTFETIHPFYDRYFAEMNRRTEVVLRAHYALSREDFLAALRSEGIDYFVFFRADITDASLKRAARTRRFWFRSLRSVAKHPANDYFLSHPPATAVAYSDERVLVLDLRVLREKENAEDGWSHSGTISGGALAPPL